MRGFVAIAVLLLAAQGCSFGYRSGDVSSGRYGARGSMHSDNSVITGIVVSVMLAEGVRYYVRGDDGSMTPLRDLPPADPQRRVSEQDCRSPVDPALGNLRCR